MGWLSLATRIVPKVWRAGSKATSTVWHGGSAVLGAGGKVLTTAARNPKTTAAVGIGAFAGWHHLEHPEDSMGTSVGKTLREGVRESARIESNSNEYQIPVFFVVDNKEKSFQFQLQYMIVVDDKHQITGRYLIEDDYYKNVFCPYISKLFDKYSPTFVQVLNVDYVDTKIKITSKDWEKELKREETWVLFNLTELISLKYSVSEIYYGTYENARYVVEIDDGNVKETVYFIDNYAIIKDRRIEIPAYLDVDAMFEEINTDYSEDVWSD